MMNHGFHIRRLPIEKGNDARGLPVIASLPRRMGRGFLSIGKGMRALVRRVRGAKTLGWRRLLFRGALACLALGLLWLLFLWWTLPSVKDPRSLLIAESTVITDRNGIELYRLFGEQDRTFVPGKDIPSAMKNAIIAIEDQRFFEHGCIDVRSVARALFANLVRGFKSQGASTLTQQLARNALLTREKRLTRKVREIMLACELERVYDKDRLLELYLNWIPFGQNAYGIEQASKAYFGISSKDLSLGKAAVLAALPQRPSYFSPYGSQVRTDVSDAFRARIAQGDIRSADDIPNEDVRIGLLGQVFGTGSTVVYLGGRSDQVLRNMQEQGFITDAERLSALEELQGIVFKRAREDIRAPHFVLWVKEQVEAMFADTEEEGLLERGGFTIETTLDWELQQVAEKAVNFHKEDAAKRFGAANIALVAMDPISKEILAYVGNSAYSDNITGGKVDMARAPRQPGSSFKPFVYAAAFERGYGPATVLYDVPTKFGEDEPQNFDGESQGLMNARRALAASRNIPAVKAFFLAGGEGPILELASKMGATSPLLSKQELALERGSFDYGWPLAIGAAETPLLEMVLGYSTFASEGKAKPVRSIRRIVSTHNALLSCPMCTKSEDTGTQVLDPRVAYSVTSILSDVEARPNEYWQNVLSVPGFQAAAKTGTSNKCLKREGEKTQCAERRPESVWTIGFSPALAAGIWVGNADSSSLAERADGLSIAAPIWRDFMGSAHKILKNPKTAFAPPPDIVQAQISLLSGELPTPCTPIALRKPDIFLKERAPSLEDPACVSLVVDRVTGLLASESCPAEARASGSFLRAVSIVPERWPLWQKGVDAWAASQMTLWNARPDHSGSLLPMPLAPTEKCNISMTPGRLVKPTVEILFPTENGTATFPTFRPQIKMKTGSHVEDITYRIDGKIVAHAGSGGELTPALRVPRSIDEGGTHTLTIQILDRYFNKAEAGVRFRFGKDETAPRMRILSPETGATFSRNDDVRIEAEATDFESGIKYVQFFLAESLLSTKPKEPFMLDFPLKSTPPGTYELRAIAKDYSGNEGESSVEIVIEE